MKEKKLVIYFISLHEIENKNNNWHLIISQIWHQIRDRLIYDLFNFIVVWNS